MHTSLSRSPFHFLRAASLSTCSLTLAAGAHVAGGGHLPAPGVLLAALALTVLAATAATRLRLSSAAMMAGLGAGQFALHEAFTAFSATPALDAGATHLHAASSPAAIGMLLAHTLATAACALLLARGEAALWALAGWLRPLVRLPEAATPDAGTPPAVPGAPAVLHLRPRRNFRQHSRRGPPSAVVLS